MWPHRGGRCVRTPPVGSSTDPAADITADADRAFRQDPADGGAPWPRPAGEALRVKAVSLKAGPFRRDDVSLYVPAGRLATLSGPVGSGKSTLAAVIAGVHPADSGRVHIAGRDVTDSPPRERSVGWVPQDGGLLPGQTVAAQIAFSLRVRGVGRDERARQAVAAAERWGVDELLERMPEQLSGGQTRLVAIARAIVSGPKLLLLDEPLASLDPPLRRTVVDRLTTWAAHTGGGVLLITHREGDAPEAAAHFVLT